MFYEVKLPAEGAKWNSCIFFYKTRFSKKSMSVRNNDFAGASVPLSLPVDITIIDLLHVRYAVKGVIDNL